MNRGLPLTPMVSPKKKKSNKKRLFDILLSIPYLAVLFIFIVLPMFILLLNSFNSESNHGFDIQFTGNHYVNIFADGFFLKPLLNSLYYSLIATAIVLVIGYPLAYFISRKKESTQAILLSLITVPMWINMLIRLHALKQSMELFIGNSFTGSGVAIVASMVYAYLPFMVLPIHSVLAKFDNNLYESAADLGANKIKTFFKVVIPLSLSGVMSGIIMVFLPAMTSIIFTSTNFFGTNTAMIGQLIEESIKRKLYGGYGYGAAISILLSILMILLVLLMRRVERKTQGGGQDEE
ncbi:ABC transporter permease [Acholeplasma sp. OttesenSCG-928-E16]|nr:ABC transporter permease [Acholeplasma sp. OttesenSCG-928-E16]